MAIVNTRQEAFSINHARFDVITVYGDWIEGEFLILTYMPSHACSRILIQEPAYHICKAFRGPYPTQTQLVNPKIIRNKRMKASSHEFVCVISRRSGECQDATEGNQCKRAEQGNTLDLHIQKVSIA